MAVVNKRRKHEHRFEQPLSPAHFLINRLGRRASMHDLSLQDLEAAAAFRLRGERQAINAAFRTLTINQCARHPAISVHERVLGGAPHIKGTRVGVTHILTHLYHLGSIDAVVDEFRERISREQVKEALAYAHDFMEIACDPSEDDD